MDRYILKHFLNLTEATIILIAAIIIVTPEIAYSLVLRGCDKIEMMIDELWIHYKRTIIF